MTHQFIIKSRFVFLLIVFVGCSYHSAFAQGCTTLGQTPSTAFPVCGTTVFSQSNVPSCVNSEVKVPGCNANQNTYYDVNPFWYKFTCFTSGSLGFTINPIDPNDDYDWQVFDITGLNPNDVFTNTTIVVGANWSGLTGQTGTSASASGLIECGSFNNNNPPKFSKLPNIVAGHTYLLMVSNFSNSQKGYGLSFNGGTAVITDPKNPLLADVKPNCGGDQLRVKLNKKMKCSSVALNGSDVVSFPGGINAVSVTPVGCNSSFETDSLLITLSQPLAPGNYSLQLKNGSDGNTILDLCDRPIPTTDVLDFAILVSQPTKLDSIVPVGCAPVEVKFVFKKLIKCSSVDPGGSDFVISGSYPVTITGAKTNCNTDGFTSEIILSFAQPLQTAGAFTVTLKPGFDGNTIVDECNQVTPVTQISFATKDTVDADFNYSVVYGCLADTIIYAHQGGNGINSWLWNFGSGPAATNQNVQVIYNVFGDKTTTLAVSNGLCHDSVTKTIKLDNFLKADFTIDTLNCPEEPVLMTGVAISERPITHYWSFGDGQSSTDEQPLQHSYPVSVNTIKYKVSYTITNDLGCTSTTEKIVSVANTCRIDVPNAFTPNGDGVNDFFGPLNAIKADQLIFRVYNRWGNLIFETKDWLTGWDGRYKGIDQDPSTYVWRLSYIHRDTKQSIELKGTVQLIR